MKKRTALVTGGAGFIGSHLAKALIADSWSVLVLDNLSTGFLSNIPPEADFIKLDLSKEGFEKKLPSHKFDALFHLAAQSSGEISFDRPGYDVKTNTVGTLMLLQWCYEFGTKHHLYASSMSIYGDVDVQPVIENTFPQPISLYGVGKLASENYIRIFQSMGINSTSLRLFNVYGPGQNIQNMKQGMVSIYMAYILKKEEVLVKGSPDRYRDFVYIDDVVDSFMSCVGNSLTFGKSYNVASGTKVYVKELLHEMLKAFGLNPSTYPIKYSGSTPGDTFGIFADIKAIRNDIGWMPKISLSKGLKKMAEWAFSVKN